MKEQLNFEQLKNAVAGTAAAFRCRTVLEPDAGDGGKVFPPTYAGGMYAVEDRRINGEVVRCVLLDSVQSQANRMEEVLLDAFLPNWYDLEPDGEAPACLLPLIAVHVKNHGWVTSLTAPHRIHDAILRDSNYNGTRFRDSDIGQAIGVAKIHSATNFYKYCPTALLFGTWDSTSGEGQNAAKVPRAIVSEIIGVNITAGVRTGSRIDPLGIKAQSATIYKRKDGRWALKDGDNWIGASENEIQKNPKGDPEKFGKGKPSDINHGNVTPDMVRFNRDEIQKQKLDRLPDIVASNGEMTGIRDGARKPGGVTMEYALHTWTLSLTQLRRLRFPALEATSAIKAKPDERNQAARTVLAALALYALVLQHERGYWLRSRCELIPKKEFSLELLEGSCLEFLPGSAQDIREKLLNPAIREAEELGFVWENRVIRLTPTEELKKLVEFSDARQQAEEDVDREEAIIDAGAES